MGDAFICRRGGSGYSGFPEFTYSGVYQLVDDGKEGSTQNWRLKLLSSGTLAFSKINSDIDVFLVGGGGGGGGWGDGTGAGGGYTTTSMYLCPSRQTPFKIEIGAGGANAGYTSYDYGGSRGATGGTTTAFGFSTNGGEGGLHRMRNDTTMAGGRGGSGGGSHEAGGGANGGNGGGVGGIGQGSTTREFAEPSGELYAGGGGGSRSSGGAGGGGSGRYNAPGIAESNGGVNTGGGAGAYCITAVGGSGIVVLRNHRGVS